MTNILSKLKELRDQDFVAAEKCSKDAAIFKALISKLPSCLPQPDLVFTKTSLLTDHDVVIQYLLLEDENPEPLRMLLSMLFGADVWAAAKNKETEDIIIRSSLLVDGLTVLLTVQANEDVYYYEPITDCGDYTVGTFKLKKFVPYDIVREYVGADFLGEFQITFGINATILSWWTTLLDDTIAYIPPDFPVPDDIHGGYGGLFDINLIYSEDHAGKLRESIHRFSDNLNWILSWEKPIGKATLSTNFLITTENRSIRLQISIENPRLDKEILIFESEDEECVSYQAFREDDDDYVLRMQEIFENLDE